MLVLISLRTDTRESSQAWMVNLMLLAETMVLKQDKTLELTHLILMLEKDMG